MNWTSLLNQKANTSSPRRPCPIAGSSSTKRSAAGRPDQPRASLVPSFIISLDADPALYSHFSAGRTKNSYRSSASTANQRIVAALKAPTTPSMRCVASPCRKSGQASRLLPVPRQGTASGRRAGTGSQAGSHPRPWYSSCDGDRRVTWPSPIPYLFASTGELGITVAQPCPTASACWPRTSACSSLRTPSSLACNFRPTAPSPCRTSAAKCWPSTARVPGSPVCRSPR